MKTTQDVIPTRTFSTAAINDSSKLMSLLALAAGAAAMPQTGHADIIYTDLSSNPVLVGYGGGTDVYQVVIPGTAIFKFERRQGTAQTNLGSLTYKYRTVRAGDFGATTPPVKLHEIATPNNFAAPQNFGAGWDQPLALSYKVTIGSVTDLGGKFPTTSYDNKYLAWQFGDSTAGGATRYGWMEISLAQRGYNAGGPLVTIFRYGWDNTGAKPTMGQLPIPEPSSAAIVALGAMALGARGVRNWRQKRNTTPVS